MPTVDSAGFVTYADDLFIGEINITGIKGNESGLRNGLLKDTLSASFLSKAVIAQPDFDESSTIGWLAIRV